MEHLLYLLGLFYFFLELSKERFFKKYKRTRAKYSRRLKPLPTYPHVRQPEACVWLFGQFREVPKNLDFVGLSIDLGHRSSTS